MIGIIVDIDGELMLSKGSLRIGDNKAQLVQHVVVCGQGELKHAPMVGCNLRRMLGGSVDPFFNLEAKRQIERQGVVVNSIQVQGGNVDIDYK